MLKACQGLFQDDLTTVMTMMTFGDEYLQPYQSPCVQGNNASAEHKQCLPHIASLLAEIAPAYALDKVQTALHICC